MKYYIDIMICLEEKKERKKEIQLIVYTSFNKKKVSVTEY